MLSGVALSVDVLADSISPEDDLQFISPSFVIDPGSLSNESLAGVSGLGLESQKLTSHEQLTVILWDEINKGKHTQSITSTDGNTHAQSVSLSILGN
tara:strand:+ start:1819 stop:2109 length:291 start_codon:yes stop_codon:yes gene_type:complete